MPRKSYVTSMPDKTGAFLLASKIIARNNGNIVRASYNKAVDLHTLFIDVDAEESDLLKITAELAQVGYLNSLLPETNVIIVEIRIPDVPGAVLPVLKILDRYDINISYINSTSDNTGYQNFKMGLLIENPSVIKMLLDDISELYQINILDYDYSGGTLDNTIFYIRLGNEMQKLLGLDSTKTMEFINESNRIMQLLQDKGEDPGKVFEHIRSFAHFISSRRGEGFKADIQKLDINQNISLYSIQPPCGSNTYIIRDSDSAALIDTGYAVYAEEMFTIFRKLFADWDKLHKRIYITHADVDHCGLIAKLPGVPVYLNQKSAEGLLRQHAGSPDYREHNDLSLGYSKLSMIISGYMPPSGDSFIIIDKGTPAEHSDILHIADIEMAGLKFKVFEGSGGHLYGETIFISSDCGIVFTGDNLVNISGFSPERAQFNSLAPYLMRSVNVDSNKANRMRGQIIELIETLQDSCGKPFVVCGGHGPLSLLRQGKLVSLPDANISL